MKIAHRRTATGRRARKGWRHSQRVGGGSKKKAPDVAGASGRKPPRGTLGGVMLQLDADQIPVGQNVGQPSARRAAGPQPPSQPPRSPNLPKEYTLAPHPPLPSLFY